MDFTKGPWVRMMEDLDMSGRGEGGGGNEGRWCVSPRSTVVVDVCWLTGTGCFPASHRSTLGSPPSVHCCGIAQAGMLVPLLPTQTGTRLWLLRGIDRTRYVCVLSISLVIHMVVCMECKVCVTIRFWFSFANPRSNTFPSTRTIALVEGIAPSAAKWQGGSPESHAQVPVPDVKQRERKCCAR